MLESIYRSVYWLFIAVVLNTLLATAILYLFYQNNDITPKTVLVFYGIAVFLLSVVWRFLSYELFFSNVRYQKRVLLIGGKSDNPELAKISKISKTSDYKIIGYVAEDSNFQTSPFPEIPFLGNIKDIKRIINEQKAEELILALDYKNNPHFIQELSDSLTLGVKIFEWQVFFEYVFQKVPTNQIDHFWFIQNFGENHNKLYERIKRLIDILVASFGIVFLALIFLPIAILIKATSQGPVFYKHKRMGFNGNLFTLIKFRSMRDDAEKDGAQWTKKNDERVTKIGKFIRKSKIDEFPQFINVLKGEMSLIGPRPERPEFLPILEEKIPFYYKRHMVKPGITGFAQVIYPYAATVDDSLEKIGYDLFYIKNRSFYLYVKIILLTIRTMLSMKGR